MERKTSETPKIVFNRPPDTGHILSVLAQLWGEEHGAEAVFVRADHAS